MFYLYTMAGDVFNSQFAITCMDFVLASESEIEFAQLVFHCAYQLDSNIGE